MASSKSGCYVFKCITQTKEIYLINKGNTDSNTVNDKDTDTDNSLDTDKTNLDSMTTLILIS